MMGRAGDRSTVCRLIASGLVVFTQYSTSQHLEFAACTRPCFVICDGFHRSAQERGAKEPLAYGKGGLAHVHGNVASIHLVLVFHDDRAKRLDVLHVRALFSILSFWLTFTLQLIRPAQGLFWNSHKIFYQLEALSAPVALTMIRKHA